VGSLVVLDELPPLLLSLAGGLLARVLRHGAESLETVSGCRGGVLRAAEPAATLSSRGTSVPARRLAWRQRGWRLTALTDFSKAGGGQALTGSVSLDFLADRVNERTTHSTSACCWSMVPRRIW